MTEDVNNQGDPNLGDSDTSSSTGGDQTIPKSRLDSVLAKNKVLEETNQNLINSLANQNGSSPAVAPAQADAPAKDERIYTRAELEQAVDQNLITEDKIEGILDHQRTQAAKKAAVDTVQGQQREEKRNAELLRYKALKPEAWAVGTADRTKLQTKFDILVSEGRNANDPSLELDAVRGCFGDIDALEAAHKGTGRDRNTHQETGAGGMDVSVPSGDGSDVKMTARQKDYYSNKVGPGKLYPDWKAVNEELKHQNKDLSLRSNAR
ncbi:hypothetical protein KAR91_51915 [Candidatus Pacearchaeota archaeon]|nr:hypothetical protein [Candidatus Pacearchaeota archaeon]